jgi:hypoxanthine phosphoribosyltransferase
MEFEDVSGDIESVVLTRQQIAEGIARMARDIERDHPGVTPLLVGVLSGAVMMMADLSRELRIPVEMEWMALSSYGASTQSSGVVKVVKDLEVSLEDRHVIVVEDIVDSGMSLSWLLNNLAGRSAASVKVAALLRKPEALQVEVPIDYLGFDIPNNFVVGFGLDYAESYRNLTGVGILKPSVYGGP